MRVSRLLTLLLLISVCAATAAAQSSPGNSSDSSQPASARNPETGTSENGSVAIRPMDSRSQHILTLQQDEKTCYTLRTYRVARENPESDSTRPAGYSTCQRATRFQLRTADDSREIAPR
jgi:hypothetical protein